MKFYILIVFILVSLSSCIIVKIEDSNYKEVSANRIVHYSPRPKVDMSDELIRTESGDMIALLPANWFFVEYGNEENTNEVALAVNQDYTLALVINEIKKSPENDKVFNENGLLGIAKISFISHANKTGSNLELYGNYQQVEFGVNQFIRYSTTSTGGALISKNAVFVANSQRYYEVAMIPMDVIGKTIPSPEEIEDIFFSVLCTVKY